MPYTKMSQVNKAVRGIDPPVTLAQANEIAEMADAVEQKGGAKSPWAVAIAHFKDKSHKVSGDGKGWVKRKSVKESSDEEDSALLIVESPDSLLEARPRHNHYECMRCYESPIVVVLWADGQGRAWFCLKDFKEWVKEEDRKIVGAWFVRGDEVPYRVGEDSPQVQKLQGGLKPEEIIERLEKCLALRISNVARIAETYTDQGQLINLEKYNEAGFDTLVKRGYEADPSWICGFWCQGPESKTGDGLVCYLNLSGARESIRNGFLSLPAKTVQEAIDSSYELWQASLSKLAEVIQSKQASD